LLVNLAILRFLADLSLGGLAAAVSSLERFLATQLKSLFEIFQDMSLQTEIVLDQ
jgi:hypothetical protein